MLTADTTSDEQSRAHKSRICIVGTTIGMGLLTVFWMYWPALVAVALGLVLVYSVVPMLMS